jgi:DNA-binding NarL/FixJ family response regulator
MHPDDERITVVIVDDDDDFRLLVGAVLARDPDIFVAGQAQDAEEAVALALELLPDVVLLDLCMPATGEPGVAPSGRGGIDAAAAISRAVPTTKIVMLTGSDEEHDVYEALVAGASGYLLKADLLDDLTRVVRMVAHSLGLLLSPSIAAKVITQFKAAPPHSVAPTLSPREVEVLQLVGLGRTNDQIATELFLSPHTVKRHVANILAKLHQRSRADAVAYAARHDVAPG